VIIIYYIYAYFLVYFLSQSTLFKIISNFILNIKCNFSFIYTVNVIVHIDEYNSIIVISGNTSGAYFMFSLWIDKEKSWSEIREWSIDVMIVCV
jgi:hypothetical protein